jgi:hypothetical protein
MNQPSLVNPLQARGRLARIVTASFSLMTSVKSSVALASAGAVAALFSAMPAQAITFDFTGAATVGGTPSKTYTQSGITLSFTPSAGSAMTNVAQSLNGLCLYANADFATPRCGVPETSTSSGTYNLIRMTTNTAIKLKTFNIKQLLTGDGGSLGNILVKDAYSGGNLLSTINISTVGSDVAFDPNITLAAGSSIYFDGSGTIGSVRFQSFEVEAVPTPAPLPLAGGVIAFGWGRKIRNRIKLSADS